MSIVRIKTLLGIVFICLYCTGNGHAQERLSFKDTIAAYNKKLFRVNRTGMEVLGAWGIANMAEGTTGYFTAKQDEWKYFHAMNFLWGAVNTGISAVALTGLRRQMALKMNAAQSYARYRSVKRLYLLNAGFDILYIATGVGLTAYGVSAKNNAAVFTGFGRSVAMQGVFLLLFDNIMFAAHQRNNSNWFRIMNEIRVSGSSIGINHTFK